MKRIILSTAFSVLAFISFGQNIDQIYTSDGSKYEGFICEQIPGETLSVYAEKALIVLPTNSIKNSRKDYKMFKDLSPLAQDWCREQGDTTFVEIVSFEANGKYYDDVFINSTTGSNTSIIAFNRKTYKLDWKTIVKTTKKYLGEMNPYGLNDVVTLKNGKRYVGTIIEQVIGENLTLVVEDGSSEKIPMSEILSTRVGENCDSTAFSHTQLLDRIEIDGKRIVEGIITSRILGQSLNILTKGNNYEESYDLAEISRYQKFRNMDYKNNVPSVSVVDTSKVLIVNGQELKFSHLVEFNNYNYVVPSDTIVVAIGATVKVMAKNIECEKNASLYATTPFPYRDRNGNGIATYRKKYPAFEKNHWAEIECIVIHDGNEAIIECNTKEKGMYFLTFTKEKDKGIFIVVE